MKGIADSIEKLGRGQAFKVIGRVRNRSKHAQREKKMRIRIQLGSGNSPEAIKNIKFEDRAKMLWTFPCLSKSPPGPLSDSLRIHWESLGLKSVDSTPFLSFFD